MILFTYNKPHITVNSLFQTLFLIRRNVRMAISYTRLPDGLVVRIRRSHRRGRGSIPRTGDEFCQDMQANSQFMKAMYDINHVAINPKHVSLGSCS